LHHYTALVCLTAKERKVFSLGSLVSLRVHAEKKRRSENLFACALHVLKDKRRGPVWNHEELCAGPAGLC
jgi:recombination protein RecA